MHVEIVLPTVVEGEWTLRDAEGEVIAESQNQPGATLTIEPFFYRNTYSQVIGRTTTKGKKGQEMRNVLRVAAQTGKITAELATETPARIVPKFDTQPKEAK